MTLAIESIGGAPIERWRALLARARLARARLYGSFVGMDERAVPRDFATFVYYHDAIQRIPERYALPEPIRLAQFEAFLRHTQGRYAVTCDTYASLYATRLGTVLGHAIDLQDLVDT